MCALHGVVHLLLTADRRIGMIKKFLGQVPTQAKDGTYKVGNKDFNTMREEHGITKESQKAIREFTDTVGREVIAVLGAEAAKTKQKVKIVLGAGDGSQTWTVHAEKEGRNPSNGEKLTTFGAISYQVKAKTPGGAEFKDEHNAMREKIKKAILD